MSQERSEEVAESFVGTFPQTYSDTGLNLSGDGGKGMEVKMLTKS